MSLSKVALALDLTDPKAIENLLAKLKPTPKVIKIGLELTSAIGISSAVELVNALAPESDIFLDLKLHDIPNTVSRAVTTLRRLSTKRVKFLTLHALGGLKMLQEAHKAGEGQLELVAVTVLTSHNQAYLSHELGVNIALNELSANLVDLIPQAGLRWIVASAQECPSLKKLHPNLKIITPGIRPSSAEKHDQERVVTPKVALSYGADLLVIGRPIYAAQQPELAWESIGQELN